MTNIHVVQQVRVVSRTLNELHRGSDIHDIITHKHIHR